MRQDEKNSLRAIVIKSIHLVLSAEQHAPSAKSGKNMEPVSRAADVHRHQAQEKISKRSDVWFVQPPDWPPERGDIFNPVS